MTRHLRSALSRGAGYERTPIGSHVGSAAVRGYYIDFAAKTTSPTADRPEQLVPAGLAQLALGWWERSLEGHPGAEQRFMDTCRLLEASSVADGPARVWPYAVTVRKFRLEPLWISALAQGQAASAFVRAHLVDGSGRYAELARAAAAPLMQEGPPSVVARLPGCPALEECPTEPPSLILNGWIYAAWGLRDVALGLESAEAMGAFDATVRCLLANLDRYDTGWWSRYSLYPHRLPDLAKPFYHRLHVDQLTVLAAQTGDARCADLAATWRGYDTVRGRVRLLAQKAAFVASGYR